MVKKNEQTVKFEQENRYYYDFSTSKSLKETFPNVDEINIKLKFSYDDFVQNSDLVFKENDKAFFQIKCSNKDCIHGGFNLTNHIHESINNRLETKIGSETCNGWQDFERYKAQNYHCLCKLNYEVKFKYRNQP